MGNILEAKVDVIVNPTHSSLKLNWGSLSKTVLAAAGPEIQHECTLNYPNGIDYDQMAETSAGRILGAKRLFHITCPAFADVETGGKSIRNIVTNCLKKLAEKNFSSIAIPSIGAGGLAHPADLVAKSSLQSIIGYLNINRTKKFFVRIVIFQQDIHIYQVSLLVIKLGFF